MNRGARLPVLALALLALLSSTGCGMMRLRGGEVERVEGWPLSERINAGMTPSGELQFSGRANLPSCLVRISLEKVAQDLEQSNEPKLNLKLYRSAFHSGLFSSVTYQYDTERYAVETDFTLDMTLTSELESGWYSFVGGFTLGALPFWTHTNYALRCVVRDRDHEILGTIEKDDFLTDVYWLPFLAFNIVFDLIDFLRLGTIFGLSERAWEEKEKALVENMFRSTLTDVRDVILEAVRKKRQAAGPPPPPKESKEEHGEEEGEDGTKSPPDGE